MRELPSLPDQLGVFTTAQASDAGWSGSALVNTVRRGDLRRVRRGAYAPPLDTTAPGSAALAAAQTAVAVSLGTPACVVSHLAAATAHGMPTWAPYPRACVTIADRSRLQLAGVHVHRAVVDAQALRTRITSVARTVADIAREFGTEAALVTADAALHTGRLRAVELHRELDRHRAWPGGQRAARLGPLVDPAAESPLESRSRWQLLVHAVAAPLTQVDLYTVEMEFLGRADFFWPEGVVGEVDGGSKYTDVAVLRKEKQRQERMERVDLQMARWGAADLDRFETIAHLINVKRARARALAGPRRWMLAMPAESPLAL